VTGLFGSDDLEAADKFQAALKVKEQLAALFNFNLQLEATRKLQAETYRDQSASS
jgi:hypothetical protein